MLVKHSLQDSGIAFCDEPVLTHFSKSVDEELDLGTELVLDCGAVDEEESGCNPEGKSEGWPEFGEHAVLHDIFAQCGDIFDGAVAALTGAIGRREDWGAGCGVRG